MYAPSSKFYPMLKGAYHIVFAKIKEIRGPSLDDYPSNFYEIMLVFDETQRIKEHGVQIAEELISKTSLWLRIIGNIGGKDCPKYIVASNKIGYNCLQLISDVVDRSYTKALGSDLEEQKKLEFASRLSGIHNVLKFVEGLYLTPEWLKVYKDMISRLAVAEELLNAGVAIS